MTEQAIVQQTAGLTEGRITRVAQQVKLMEQLADEVLQEGTDYGIIPGTDRPTLLKPGAEAIIGAINCYTRPTVLEREVNPDTGFYYVLIQSDVVSRDTGEVVVSGLGSASSYERKYRYRQADKHCPICGVTAIIKGKAEYGGGWVCWNRRGGCGSQFSDNDPGIVQQATGMVEQPDLLDLVNTYDKMAEKRADVDAALKLPGVARRFTQDMEDFAARVVDDSTTRTQEPEAAFEQRKYLCEKHDKGFTRREGRNGQVWYSHREGNAWCNADAKLVKLWETGEMDAPDPEPEPEPEPVPANDGMVREELIQAVQERGLTLQQLDVILGAKLDAYLKTHTCDEAWAAVEAHLAKGAA